MATSQIFLNTLSGATAVVRDARTFGDLQAAAASAHPGLSASDLRLSHSSRPLPDTLPADTPLLDLGIADNANVYALARLLGGGKKRKKKTYTKPKKIKHQHKAAKLAVLKYYKVDNEGKVERLRKECPAEMCGAGVFMADHSDRVYCGKCGLTYVKS